MRKIQVICDLTLCHWASGCQSFEELQVPFSSSSTSDCLTLQDVGTAVPQNMSKYSPSDKPSHPKGPDTLNHNSVCINPITKTHTQFFPVPEQ